MWLGIHSCYRFIESLEVGGVRHEQSDSIERLNYI